MTGAMRILFLNQYFPPDPAPTGVLLAEIAESLKAVGHEVVFVDAREDYRAGQKRGGRMVRELKSLVRMLFAALRVRRVDVVVSGTSPPCLAFVAALVAERHRARSVHWAMDVYPEIAVALGELRDGALSRFIASLMGWAYRRSEPVVVLDEDMAAKLRRYVSRTETIRPWVVAPLLDEASATIAPREPWTWIYSGNLGRAHEWATLLEAQATLERRGIDARLVFQGSGPSSAAAQARAVELGLKRCEWRPYAAPDSVRSSLLECHCFAVTQLPAARGLLWPSKLSLLLTLPRPIVFVGDVNGAIASELRGLSQAAVFAPGESERLAEWLARLREQGTPADCVTHDAGAHRRHSLAAFHRLIMGSPGAT